MRLTFDFGLNETESVQLSEAREGYNFDLEQGATRLFPRRAIDKKGQVKDQSSVNGIMQLITRDDTETTLVNAGSGTVYKWTGEDYFGGWTSVRTTNVASTSLMRGQYWSLSDYLVITDIRKLTPLLNWDGTTCSRHKTGLTSGSAGATTLTCSTGVVTAVKATHGYAIGDLVTVAGANETAFNGEHEVTTVPSAGAFTYAITSCPTTTATGTITSDLGVELFAKYSAVHNNRLWLFNVKTDSDDNPHMILASEFEDPESFDTVVRSGIATGNEPFYTLSPDLKPINGVAVFNKQLIISTVDGALHRLVGIDAADYQFKTYFAGSAAIGTESMVNMGNDVIYPRRGGNIDLLSATDTSGDVRADDVSRWIPESVKDITDSITVYDQQNQKVLFFIGDEILVLFKDMFISGGGSPWSKYITKVIDSSEASIFNTDAALFMRRPGESTYSVYFGDSDGNIYDLNGSGLGDNGTDIPVKRKTNYIESSRLPIIQGSIQYRRIGTTPVSLIFDWGNEYNTTQSDIVLKGPPAGSIPPFYNSDPVLVTYGILLESGDQMITEAFGAILQE